MKAVVQRVISGKVAIDGETVAAIERGLVILLGVGKGDTEETAVWLARKCAGLRIFEDDQGLMNLGLAEVAGKAIVVSQFTLYGDTGRGKRPSFADSAPPEVAEPLYNFFVAAMRAEGVEVQTGRFQSKMEVAILNDGPVTLIIER